MTVTRGASEPRDLAEELVLLQLGTVPLFGRCTERQLADVVSVSGERRFAVGDTVARAGTVVRDVPIVLEGYGGAGSSWVRGPRSAGPKHSTADCTPSRWWRRRPWSSGSSRLRTSQI